MADSVDLNGLLLKLSGDDRPHSGRADKKTEPTMPQSSVFLGVYDGHGGDSVSAYLRDFLHTEIKSELVNGAQSEGNLNDVISTSFKEAYKRIHEVCCLFLVQLTYNCRSCQTTA